MGEIERWRRLGNRAGDMPGRTMRFKSTMTGLPTSDPGKTDLAKKPEPFRNPIELQHDPMRPEIPLQGPPPSKREERLFITGFLMREIEQQVQQRIAPSVEGRTYQWREVLEIARFAADTAVYNLMYGISTAEAAKIANDEYDNQPIQPILKED